MYYQKIEQPGKVGFTIYLHGWGLDSSAMKRLAMLNKSTNVIIVDLPGFGKSELTHPYTIQDYVQELHNLVVHEQIESFYGVGHSFGGKILGFYATQYLVKGLCLIAPSIIKRHTIKAKVKITFNKIAKKIKLPIVLKGSSDYEATQGNLRKTFVNVCNSYLSKKDLKKINTDILLIGLKKDREIVRFQLNKMHRYLKKSKLIFFEGDHLAYLSHKKDIASLIDKGIEKCF